MENQQELKGDEALNRFCSIFRKQLALSSFSLRLTKKTGQITITAPSGNQWFVGYLDFTTWSNGALFVCSVADYSRIKLEGITATSHFRHAFSSFKQLQE